MGRRASCALAVLLWSTSAWAAIALRGTANIPTTDNGTNAGPTCTFANPPVADMAADDYVVVAVCYRGTVTLTNSATGGQTWTKETEQDQTNANCALFHARFNGTWSAAPAFTNTTGTATLTCRMSVWTGVDTSTALDAAVVQSTYAAPTTPFAVSNAGVTTVTNNAVVLYYWTSSDNNVWTHSGGLTGFSPWRNSGGSDNSIAWGYKTVASFGGSGSEDATQSTLGGDAGVVHALALRPASTPAAVRNVLVD